MATEQANEETIDKENEEENSQEPIGTYPWERYYAESTSPWIGWTNTYEQAKELISVFEMCTNTSYVLEYKRTSGAVVGIDLMKGHFVRYKDPADPTFKYSELLQFDGTPFMCINHERHECHRGVKGSGRSDKKEDHENKSKRKRNVVKASKKIGCTARVIIREIYRFPAFKIDKNTRAKRNHSSKKLRKALNENAEAIEVEKRYYVCLPLTTDHNHETSEDFVQSIDYRLKEKIRHLVSEGVPTVVDVKRHLAEFLMANRLEWFPDGALPPLSNKRFFPSKETIRNHVNIALNKQKRTHTFIVENLEELPLHTEEGPPQLDDVTKYAGNCRALLKELINSTSRIKDPQILNDFQLRIQDMYHWIVSKTSVSEEPVFKKKRKEHAPRKRKGKHLLVETAPKVARIEDDVMVDFEQPEMEVQQMNEVADYVTIVMNEVPDGTLNSQMADNRIMEGIDTSQLHISGDLEVQEEEVMQSTNDEDKDGGVFTVENIILVVSTNEAGETVEQSLVYT